MPPVLRILYVDDEPGLLELGKRALEESGDFLITTAESATKALSLLNGEQFDAVVSDYQMPGMDGIQFLIEVWMKFGPIPFILFTGKGREEVVIQAINSGVDFVSLEFNKAAEKTENISRNEVPGHRLTEVFPGVQEFGLVRGSHA